MSLEDFTAKYLGAVANNTELKTLATPKRIKQFYQSTKNPDVRDFIDHLKFLSAKDGTGRKPKPKEFFTKKIKLFHAPKRIPKDFLDDFTRSKNGGFLPESTLIRGERCHPKPVCNDPDGGSWQFCILKEETFFSGKDLLKDYLNLQLPNFYCGENLHALTEERKIGIKDFIEKYGSPEFVPLGWDFYTGFCYARSLFVTAHEICKQIPDFPSDDPKRKTIKLYGYPEPLRLAEWRREAEQGFAAAELRRAKEKRLPINFDEEYQNPLAYLYRLVFLERTTVKRCPVCGKSFCRSRSARTCGGRCKEKLKKRKQREKKRA